MARKITMVEVQDRHPYGEEVADDLAAMDPGTTSFELPGYSEKVRNRELAVRDFTMGKISEMPPPLEFRIQLARREGFDGKPDRRRVGHWEREGYKIATIQELRDKGITLEGSSYREEVDGTVTTADYVVMIAPARVAAKRFARVRDAGQQQLDTASQMLQGAAESYNAQNHPEGAGGTKAFSEHKPAKGVAKLKQK